MSKEFKNIEELFRSTVGTGTAKAPSHVKTNVLNKTSGKNGWLVGFGLLFLTTIFGIISLFSLDNKTSAKRYQGRAYTNIVTHLYNSPSGLKKIDSQDQLTELATNYTSQNNLSSKKHKQSDNLIALKTNRKSQKKTLLSKTKTPILKKDKALTTTRTETSEGKHSETNAVSNGLHTYEVNSASSNEHNPETTHAVPEYSPDISEHYQKNGSDTIGHSTEPMPILASVDTNINFDEKNTLQTVDSNQTSTEIASMNDTIQEEIKIDIDPKEKKGSWMIGFTGGPNINNVNYTQTGHDESLNKYHDEKLGYFGKIYGQYLTRSNWMAGLGLGIESQAYNTTFLTKDTTFSYPTNPVADTVLIIHLKNHHGVANNQYIRIPLHFGYRIERNKWLFGLETGIRFNYLLATSGTYINNNEVFSLKKNTIMKHITINYSLGGTVQYNLFKNTYLTGSVGYTPGLQNYYQDFYARRSINTISLGFGASFRF